MKISDELKALLKEIFNEMDNTKSEYQRDLQYFKKTGDSGELQNWYNYELGKGHLIHAYRIIKDIDVNEDFTYQYFDFSELLKLLYMAYSENTHVYDYLVKDIDFINPSELYKVTANGVVKPFTIEEFDKAVSYAFETGAL